MHWMVRVIRRGVAGVEKAAYTENVSAGVYATEPPVSLPLCWVWQQQPLVVGWSRLLGNAL